MKAVVIGGHLLYIFAPFWCTDSPLGWWSIGSIKKGRTKIHIQRVCVCRQNTRKKRRSNHQQVQEEEEEEKKGLKEEEEETDRNSRLCRCSRREEKKKDNRGRENLSYLWVDPTEKGGSNGAFEEKDRKYYEGSVKLVFTFAQTHRDGRTDAARQSSASARIGSCPVHYR